MCAGCRDSSGASIPSGLSGAVQFKSDKSVYIGQSYGESASGGGLGSGGDAESQPFGQSFGGDLSVVYV